MLWWYRAPPNFPAGHDSTKDPLDAKLSREDASVIREPITVTIDGDIFVIAAFVSHSANLRTKSGKVMIQDQPIFYVDAVNARTGKRVWRRILDLPELRSNMASAVVRIFQPKPEFERLAGNSVVVLGVG